MLKKQPLSVVRFALVDTDYIQIDDIRASGSFTGGASNRWSHAVVHDANEFTNNSGGALVISNNVDLPYYFEGHSTARLVALDVSGFNSVQEWKDEVKKLNKNRWIPEYLIFLRVTMID